MENVVRSGFVPGALRKQGFRTACRGGAVGSAGGRRAAPLGRTAWVCIAALVALGGAAATNAATHTEDEARVILSEDGFGVCVPEEHLDDIWLVLAKGGKGGRVPHVCMMGDCLDLPDIAQWAAAQQYPDDIDLDRTEVQARYAGFVAEYCGPAPEEPEEPAPEPLADPQFTPLPEPLLARTTPRLLTPTPARTSTEPTRTSTFTTGTTPLGGGSSLRVPFERTPQDGELVPDPLDNGDIPPPFGTVPLPAGIWLLLSALGAGLLLGRRRGRATEG